MDLTPNYDEEAVQPMRDELIHVGLAEMRSADQVDALFKKQGTALIIINSVCGCAAGGARPGVSLALQNDKIPDHLMTSFAGQDKAAVARIRERLSGFPPSSPFIAVLKDGKPVHVMQRTDIEGKDANRVAAELKQVFSEHCNRSGPSISAEQFAKLRGVKACGSSIPPSTMQIEGLDHGGHDAHGEDTQEAGKKWWKIFWAAAARAHSSRSPRSCRSS
jgi:putative YphP/YqiW family bacilliredoxin